MKVRTARLSVFVAAVAGLMATMIPSASATTVKEVEFVGTATVPCGLSYPVLGPPEHCTFTFSSNTCLKASVSTPDKTNPKNGVDPCQITAAGTVWGHCGQSTGVGLATVTNLSGNKGAPIDVSFTFMGVGGELIVQGTASNGATVVGVVTAIPAVGGSGSCTNGTGTDFIIIGTITYVDITPFP